MTLRLDPPTIQDLLARNDLTELKPLVRRASTTSLVDLLRALPTTERVVVFRLLDKEQALEVFETLEPEEQSELVHSLQDDEVIQLAEQLDADDRVRLFDELPAKVVKRLLAQLSPAARDAVTLLLGYPKGSAGHVMSPRYLALRADEEVTTALEQIRTSTLRPDELQVLFVIDDGRRFLGYVTPAQLLKVIPNSTVGSLAEKREVLIRATDSARQAARLLQAHDLPAVAVVDSEDRVVGAVTFDDVIDILEEDASATMYWKAGIGDVARWRDEVFSERLVRGSIWYPYRVRLLFLLVTLAGGLAVGGLIDHFEEVLATVVTAAVFIPLIMDMGGNTGTQSTTIFARGLALGHIQLDRFARHLGREALVGLLMGVTLGTAAGVVAYLWQGRPNDIPQLSIAVGVALGIVVMLGAVLGFILPYILLKLGLDHAPGADPFITTIKDCTGLAIYFSLVSWLLGIGEEAASLAFLLPRSFS